MIDEDALVRALRSGKLFAAGLDVFRTEPGGNPLPASLPNVFLLPHIGSATEETRDMIGFRALDCLDAFLPRVSRQTAWPDCRTAARITAAIRRLP